MGTRSARDSNSRESAERIQQWRPGSALTPQRSLYGYIDGFVNLSWNMMIRLTFIKNGKRDGNLFALKSTLIMLAPSLTKEETQAPLVCGGSFWPESLKNLPVKEGQRNNTLHKWHNQMDAVDRDWMRENNALMPKLAPQRKSSVSFGSRNKSEG